MPRNRRRRSRLRPSVRLLPNGKTETIWARPGVNYTFLSVKRYRDQVLRAYEVDPRSFPVGIYTNEGVSQTVFDGSPYRNNYSFSAKCWDRLNPGPPWHPWLGGPLRMIKVVSQWHVLQGQGTYYGANGTLGRRIYVGGFIPSYFGGDSNLTNSGQVNVVGLAGTYGPNYGNPPSGADASAWNKFAPKQSPIDLAVSLAEAREIPGMLKTTAGSFRSAWKALGGNSRGRPVKEASNQFLNDQFGWSPFLADLKKLFLTYESMDRALKQLKRDNNRWIRRKGTFSQTTNSVLHEHFSLPKVYPTLVTQMYAPGDTGFTDIYKVDRTKIWFEADFKYYIPSYDPTSRVPDKLRYAMDLLRLYGLRVNPSVIWEATPWSWLADWFSNTGKVIQNLTLMASDRLCSRYAFLMTQSSRDYVNHSVVRLRERSVVCNWRQSVISKRRKRASPFGFSITSPSQLTDRQWSILAALGFSRVL